MKKWVSLMVVAPFLVLGVWSSALAQEAPPFPYCTDTTEYCQKKVAQVPIPWQFWGVEIDPVTGATTVIDRIRISPTWLDPPPGQPPGEGPILIRRQFARVPAGVGPIPLDQLVWDFPSDQPAPMLDWEPVDLRPIEVVEGEDVVLEIPVAEDDSAVLVAYEVMTASGEVVGHFINEAVLESMSPQTIVQIMVNFDIHNETGIDVTNFELDFLGLDFGCADVVSALGFVAGTGVPPMPIPPEIWGANEDNPLVVRPIPGGTEVKWIQPDRPLPTCEWLHVGLVFDCTNFDCFNNPDDPTLRATVQGYWTVIEPKVCDPRTQGYWKRICDGVTGGKRLHPETPADFDPTLCPALQVKGKERKDPCVRARAQQAALLLNIQNEYLAECCEVVDPAGNLISVGEAAEEVQDLIDAGLCKEASDLAESINSGDALVDDP